jgi:hypothetical protein
MKIADNPGSRFVSPPDSLRRFLNRKLQKRSRPDILRKYTIFLRLWQVSLPAGSCAEGSKLQKSEENSCRFAGVSLVIFVT